MNTNDEGGRGIKKKKKKNDCSDSDGGKERMWRDADREDVAGRGMESEDECKRMEEGFGQRVEQCGRCRRRERRGMQRERGNQRKRGKRKERGREGRGKRDADNGQRDEGGMRGRDSRIMTKGRGKQRKEQLSRDGIEKGPPVCQECGHKNQSLDPFFFFPLLHARPWHARRR